LLSEEIVLISEEIEYLPDPDEDKFPCW
jgi:hypothetical protein